MIGDARRKSFFFARIRANELVEGSNAFLGVRAEDRNSTRLRSTMPDLSPRIRSRNLSASSFVIHPLLCSPDLRENRNAAFFAAARTNLLTRAAHHHAEMESAKLYRCWAEIDRSALRHNAKIVRERDRFRGDPRCGESECLRTRFNRRSGNARG